MNRRRSYFLFFLCLFLFCSLSQANAQWMKVVRTNPAKGQKDVPLEQVIMIEFNRPVMRAVANSDLLVELPSKLPVPAVLSFSDDSKTVFITPRAPLKRNTYYSVNLFSLMSAVEQRNPYVSNLDFITEGGVFKCVCYSTPSEISLYPGGFQDIVYTFMESGGGIGEVKRCSLIYETLDGREISRSSEEMKLLLKDKETVKLPASVSLPREIGESLKGQSIYIRRIFEGVDGEGRFFSLRTGIKTSVALQPPSQGSLSSWSASVLSPDYGAVIPVGSFVSAECRIVGTPNSPIHGCWIVNGSPTGFFADSTDNSGVLKKTYTDKSLASNSGTYSIAVQVISPEKFVSDTYEYIVSSSPISSPVLMYPKPSQVFKQNSSSAPTFRWSNAQGALSYKIMISKDRNSGVWIEAPNNMYTPNWVKWSGFGSGVFYWGVKPVFPGGKEGEPSFGSFMISDVQ